MSLRTRAISVLGRGPLAEREFRLFTSQALSVIGDGMAAVLLVGGVWARAIPTEPGVAA
jgi:hypothetical protein